MRAADIVPVCASTVVPAETVTLALANVVRTTMTNVFRSSDAEAESTVRRVFRRAVALRENIISTRAGRSKRGARKFRAARSGAHSEGRQRPAAQGRAVATDFR